MNMFSTEYYCLSISNLNDEKTPTTTGEDGYGWIEDDDLDFEQYYRRKKIEHLMISAL